jgi:hypothetical protein
MCGYVFGETKPHIFLPSAILRENDGKVIASSELSRHMLSPAMIPRSGTNLTHARLARVAPDGMTQCAPILMDLSAREAEDGDEEYTGVTDLTASYDALKGICLEKLMAKRLVETDPSLTNEQREEIRETLPRLVEILSGRSARREGDPKCSVRCLRGSSQATYFKELLAAYKSKTAPAEHIADTPFLTFVVVQDGYTVEGAVPGHVYCIFYTTASSPVKAVHLESRIAVDNGHSLFSIHDPFMAAKTVAGVGYGLKEAALIYPTVFEMSMRKFLTDWRDGDVHVDTCLTSV